MSESAESPSEFRGFIVRTVIVTFSLLVAIAGPASADVLTDAAANLDAMMSALERDGSLDLDGEQIMAKGIVPRFYASNGNVPAWIDPITVGRMLEAIEDMRDDGLDPTDYHGQALFALGPDTPHDPRVLARRDVLLTDALYAMVYHLVFGKADPNRLDKDWNVDELYSRLDVADSEVRAEITARILAAISDGDPGSIIKLARPDLPLHSALRSALARYREIAASGGWTGVSDGPTLREGDTDARVTALRRRLAVTGDLPGDDPASATFDGTLTAAVIRFQRRHGLGDDGVVGKGTLAAMNVRADERADQLRINLERLRWVLRDPGYDFVLVNVAAFEVWLVRGRELRWHSRVQVGKPYTRTPIFADVMTYLEINPTWTVPASISNKSILAGLKADPAYLEPRNMVLLDSQGREVDARSVDWSALSRMPYTVRQEPGPKNALGRVKFMFPNKHAVYLHDTPSKQHFGKAARAFSHGCIRTENPFELAALLLDDQPTWTPEHIDEVIASGKRTAVRLTEPLPVFLLYWTAYVDMDGTVNFRNDLYDRDTGVLTALQGAAMPRDRHSAR